MGFTYGTGAYTSNYGTGGYTSNYGNGGYTSNYDTGAYDSNYRPRGFTPPSSSYSKSGHSFKISCDGKVPCLVVGLALASLAAVAAYFCIAHGFSLYNTAYTSLELFQGGALIYMGVAFACAAVGNALYSSCKVFCGRDAQDRGLEIYSGREAIMQIAITCLAPIAVVPVVVMGGCSMACSH